MIVALCLSTAAARRQEREASRVTATSPASSRLVPVAAAPGGHAYRRITVERVAGACGAVVGGVDLAAGLDDETVAEIRRAILDHQVVFFRDQRLDPDSPVAFSRRFGPSSPVPFIQPIPEHAEVIAVVREATETQGYTFGGLWHSDFSFLPEPPFASILHALEVPPYGGDTIFANQTLAYSTLSAGMQSMLDGLTGVHSAVNAYSPKMQKVHDTFTGMTVHTSDEANRAQLHPGRPLAPGDRPARALRERAVHRRPRRLLPARVTAAARLALRPRHPARSSRAGGTGKSVTSPCGTTGRCSTW